MTKECRMSISGKEFLDRLLEGYVSSYDIDREEDPEHQLYAKAHLHIEESQYFLMKSIQAWTADADEYAYFYITDHMTDEMAQEFIQHTYDQGFPLIKLDHLTFKKQHMVTRLVAVVLCQSMDEAAAKRIRKCSIYKSFQFSLKGWMEVHTVAVDLGKESVISNRYGKETAKFLKKILDGYPKGSQNS